MVLGDMFWRQEPAPEYRAVIGYDGWPSAGVDDVELARQGESEDLVLLYTANSSPDEWDHFEGRFATARYRRALALPEPVARAAAVEKARRWQQAYMRWGRETLGFTFYVFLKPPAAADHSRPPR